MKKIILGVLFLFCTLINCFTMVYADSKVTERPDIKVIVNGVRIEKESLQNDVPIIANERTLLPLRSLLITLGVQNDEKHIAWNGQERSVTVIKGSVRLYLKIDNSVATVNGKLVTLDSKPIIYNDKTYMPARFIAENLNYNVDWDSRTSSVLIQDVNNYKRIKDIFSKITNNDNSDICYTTQENGKIDLMNDIALKNVSYSSYIKGKYDLKNKKAYLEGREYSSLIDQSGQSRVVQKYIENNTEYSRTFNLLDKVIPSWDKENLSSEEFANKLKMDDITINDLMLNSMKIVEDKNDNNKVAFISLVNSTVLQEILDSAGVSNYKINKGYITINVDINRNIIESLGIESEGDILSIKSNGSETVLTDEQSKKIRYSFQYSVMFKIEDTGLSIDRPNDLNKVNTK